MLIGGHDLLRVDLGGQGERAGHLAFIALAAHILWLLHPFLALGGVGDGERVTQRGDLDLLWLDPRQRSLHYVLLPILRLVNVEREGATGEERKARRPD